MHSFGSFCTCEVKQQTPHSFQKDPLIITNFHFCIYQKLLKNIYFNFYSPKASKFGIILVSKDGSSLIYPSRSAIEFVYVIYRKGCARSRLAREVLILRRLRRQNFDLLTSLDLKIDLIAPKIKPYLCITIMYLPTKFHQVWSNGFCVIL